MAEPSPRSPAGTAPPFFSIVIPAYNRADKIGRTLASCLAQTDPDFTLVLMTGPDLPEPYLTQLRELTEIAPQFRLSLVPPMEQHSDACLAATLPHIDPRADVVGHFRQDDDDAVAIDYVERARGDFELLRGLWQRKTCRRPATRP